MKNANEANERMNSIASGRPNERGTSKGKRSGSGKKTSRQAVATTARRRLRSTVGLEYSTTACFVLSDKKFSSAYT
ncbi:MAG: hypothetical protein K2Z81_16275, partial [Cyanobacteria bacterium]|nr:hypothetical protein [Cyanobacteriota bacterium]